MDSQKQWKRFCREFRHWPAIGLAVDLSRLGMDEAFVERMATPLADAFAAMAELEAGAIANPDEQRMVGHYWLRNAALAPDDEIREAITSAVKQVTTLAGDVHAGRIRPPSADRFTDVLVVGIGGSALGPQLAADALGRPGADRMAVHFIDNTDGDGVARLLATIGDRLAATLVIVISKSGGTPETRNGMIAVQQRFAELKLDFAAQAVAVTSEGSKLDKLAVDQQWIARLPMWDFVGGRTSQTSAVGLLPAALQGIEIDALLAGAADCDQITRQPDFAANPAAQLALAWHYATDGAGRKDMVVLPYKDRLLLLSRYLQQLVMESLGKEKDLDGNVVEQGIAVYGNKGSTDQHAYVQQLREGVRNFFVTFIEVLEDGDGGAVEVEPGVMINDYLRGFLLGTREALSEAGRPSLTITIRRVDAYALGVLIALFERAVGLYASLININAYHQPGVEAGKKAAAAVLALQGRLMEGLDRASGGLTPEALASAVADRDGAGQPISIETTCRLLMGLAANGRVICDQPDTPLTGRYRLP